MGFVIAGFVALLVLCIAIAAHNARYGIGRKVKVQFRDSETGRTVHAGNGNSIGAAIADGFSKMWYSVSVSSREDTIKSKLDSMNRTLSENRSRMRSGDIAQCEQYISRMRGLLSQKQAERERAESEKREAEQELKRQRAERTAEIARQRREKEKELSERQRYIAEQRRIMTASMRYEVLRRDNFRCVLCGASAGDGVQLHVDHIVPLAKGGKTELSNLRTLCDRCNLGKGAKIE